jgi:MFS family permease
VPWRRNLYAVTAASFIGFTGFTLVMPFLPLFIRELGVSDVGEITLWTGAILAVTPAVTALLAPFWGRLADRFGLKVMVARSLVSCAAVMGAMAFVAHPWQVFALRAALGLFTGYGGLTLAMAAESAPRERMASAIGLIQTAQRLGPGVGPIVGGALAGVVGLRRAFFVTAGLYAVALLIVLVMYDEREAPARAGRRRTRGDVRVGSVLAFENFALLMGVVVGVQFVDRSLGPILPLYLEEVGIQPARVPVAAGTLFSIVALAGSLGHHVSGPILARWSSRAVISGAAVLSAAGVGLFAVGTGLGMMGAAAACFGLGVGAAMTAAYTAAGAVIPAGAHGTGFGLLSSASLTGVAVSPLAAGALGATSLRAVFLLDVVLLALLALIVRRVMAEAGPLRAPAMEDA